MSVSWLTLCAVIPLTLVSQTTPVEPAPPQPPEPAVQPALDKNEPATSKPDEVETQPAATKPTTAPSTQPDQPPLPDAKKVLKQAIRALAKEELAEAIESVHIKLVQFTPQPQSKHLLDITAIYPDKLKCRVERNGILEITYFQNGDLTWWEYPVPGDEEPQEVQIQRFPPTSIWRIWDLSRVALFVPFLKSKFDKAETIAQEERAGEQCYVIKLTEPNDPKPWEYPGDHLIYINAENGRIVWADQPGGRRAHQRMVSEFTKWKTFGDYTTFTRIESYWESDQRTIIIEDLSFNDVDESDFEIPEELRPNTPAPAPEDKDENVEA